MMAGIPPMESPAEATRVSGAKIINNIAAAVPTYISGSADLHGSTRNYINDGGNFGSGQDKTYAGRNLYYGIREHAMGAILNGFAYHGIFTPSGSTFLVFVDYFRATLRVAALAELPVSYILTHDSIGVGEDGERASANKACPSAAEAGC
jgi:transketolase